MVALVEENGKEELYNIFLEFGVPMKLVRLIEMSLFNNRMQTVKMIKM
jgi:hypothetical protein